MENRILRYIKPDKHTEYMACAQYADWLPQGFDTELKNAYIVQEILLEKIIDGRSNTVHYCEAWEVEEGVCRKEPFQDSHDLFCVGHPMDDSDSLKDSIGHSGTVIFTPKVYLIKKENPLYRIVATWPTNIVSEANGLNAVYYR